MAFRDTNPYGVLATQTSQSPAAGSPPQVQLLGTGEDEPQEVVIENVGFLALNGDTKVKLFAKGYDSDALPLSSVSLFSVASRSGLFAAAAHSDLIVGSTSSLREAFSSTSEAVANYRPQLSLSLPAKISHVAFTADESHLVLGSASGGLAVYSVNDLNSNSSAQPLFQLGTDGVGLREVKPNPATPEFVAIVTIKGDVQMMNINTRGFEQGSNGPILKSGASTVAWSQRGKQIICGMGDGTGWQMTPQGEGKAVLPSVPGLEGYFVSSVVWLENDLFITTHTPIPSDPQNNESVFHILTRSGASFQYTRLPDPVPPFGLDSRSPPYFFHAVIKQYEPSLKDMVIFSNTCSSDIGLVSRFSTPISGDPTIPADTWITSSIGDDTRRAQLPLTGESFLDTSTIGMALDLSNQDNVKRPVGGEEIEESPGPLPILMVLNHEGLLCAWHVVYNDAIETGKKYTGMMMYAQQDPQPQQQQQLPRPSTPPRSTSFAGTLGSPFAQTLSMGGLGFGGARPGPSISSFASSQTGTSSPGLPTGSVFGHSTSLGGSFAKPAFGHSAFGQPTALGTSTSSAFGQSSWGAVSSGPTAANTQTAFGQPSTLGAKPTFGQPATLGTGTPAPSFGTPTTLGLAKPTSAFGQASPLGVATAGGGGSGFASGSLGGGSGLAASGFGAYANRGGFAAAATTAPSNGTPIWGTGKAVSTMNTPSVFGTPSNASNPFGSGGTSNFKISSGFKADPSVVDDEKKSAAGGSFGAFGMGLGDALSTTQSAPRGINDQGLRDANMDADSDAEQDKTSDLDEDEDIITPGVRQQGGPSQMIASKPAPLPSGTFSSVTKPLPTGIFGNANASSNVVTSSSSPFASVNKPASSPFGAASGTPPASPFANVSQTKSPFAALPNTGSPLSSWTGLKQTSNPFGASTGQSPASPFAPSTKPAFGTTGLSAFATKPQTPAVNPSPKLSPSPVKVSSPEAAPLPPDFTKARTITESVKDEVPDAPLPLDFAVTMKDKKVAEDAPLPPDFTKAPKKEVSPDRAAAEEAPLPPDSTTVKAKQPDEGIPGLPEEGPEDEDEAYGGEEEEEEEEEEAEDGQQEEEEEEDEEQEDEEDEDDEEWEQDAVSVTPKGPIFTYDPKPKLSSTSPSTSNIFSTNTSFKDTIGAVDKAAPFAELFGKPTAGKETDHSKPAVKSTPAFGGAKPRSPATHGHTLSGKDKDKRSGSGMGVGGMFNKTKKPGATEIGKTASAPSGGSFFPASAPIPLPSFTTPTNRPVSAPSVFSQNLPTPGKIPAPAATVPFGGRTGKPAVTTPQLPTYNKPAPVASPFGGASFVSATSKPVKSSPLAVSPAPVSVPAQQEQSGEKKEEPEDSDLDLDKEFSDREDEKVRRKLQRGKVKPLENLPKFKSIKEVEVANDFNAVFDSIYLSGNMMVNRLGLTVRGLAAYHMGQNQSLVDVKHESAKDMGQPKDWKLCELEKVRKILEELVDGVKKENRGNEELEAQYEAANKGFIKLDTKDAEIKRLLAVHNDAQAAAIARARPLTPEQLLQQRKLRKEYTRVEKLLKDAEKEVTQLKAKIASRDKNKSGSVVPPTVEAVRNTIMKLTGMVERKNGDIEYLEERLRRTKLKSRSASATPNRSRGMTPERTIRGETPQRFDTPERSVIGGTYGYAPTPVLAVTDPVDVAEAREEMKARKEMGKKLRGVLEKSGPRMTGGQGQGQRFGQGQQGQGHGLGR